MSRIVLGVTGSIAAYKAAELASRLIKLGHEVRVVMTRSATELISPLTLQSITGKRVCQSMFEPVKESEIDHISLASWADLLVVAPATANIIGKMAAGIADDLLSTTVMATRAPVLIAPAMNTNMYENPVCQRNIACLRNLGYHFVEPGVGRLACGSSGKGRLAEIELIVEAIQDLLHRQRDLDGRQVLVTAGPTREAIDPVRYISNRSSGKMGYALAEEAAQRGARVILISGPTALQPPPGVEVVPVVTAQEMFEAVAARFAKADLVIKAAAVADFRPVQVATQKIKKGSSGLTLQLERTTDILEYLGRNKERQVLVGFAAETSDTLNRAREKLIRKNLDLVVANDVSAPGAGFGVETNIATLLFADGSQMELPKMTKKELAKVILDQAAKFL